MTARDEAIRAVVFHPWRGRTWSRHAEHRYDGGCSVCRGDVGAILDAIPAHRLARLAIERGGLVHTGVWDRVPGDEERVAVYYEDEPRPDDAPPLYRVVESDR